MKTAESPVKDYITRSGQNQWLPAIFALGTVLSLLSGCRKQSEPEKLNSPPGHSAGTLPEEEGKHNTEFAEEERGRKLDAALAHAARLREEAMRNPPKNEVLLPNYEAGPGRPYPVARNFYERNDRYPAYLLCAYSVDENHYELTNESEWFKAALLQIRTNGSNAFPPVSWIAVTILNRAEHRVGRTFEQCHKAGAIFDAKEVFDTEYDLQKAIERAEVDRHPFLFDSQQPTPREQQRWLIVERHAATNHTAKDSAKPSE